MVREAYDGNLLCLLLLDAIMFDMHLCLTIPPLHFLNLFLLILVCYFSLLKYQNIVVTNLAFVWFKCSSWQDWVWKSSVSWPLVCQNWQNIHERSWRPWWSWSSRLWCPRWVEKCNSILFCSHGIILIPLNWEVCACVVSHWRAQSSTSYALIFYILSDSSREKWISLIFGL